MANSHNHMWGVFWTVSEKWQHMMKSYDNATWNMLERKPAIFTRLLFLLQPKARSYFVVTFPPHQSGLPAASTCFLECQLLKLFNIRRISAWVTPSLFPHPTFPPPTFLSGQNGMLNVTKQTSNFPAVRLFTRYIRNTYRYLHAYMLLYQWLHTCSF